jgi:hypothetical protein
MRPWPGFAFDESSLIQDLAKGIDSIREAGSRGAPEKSDHWHRGLLRARRERPHRHRAAEKRDELASFQLIELHSIPVSQSRIAGYHAEVAAVIPTVFFLSGSTRLI